jgi:hypothetical protein
VRKIGEFRSVCPMGCPARLDVGASLLLSGYHSTETLAVKYCHKRFLDWHNVSRAAPLPIGPSREVASAYCSSVARFTAV